MIAGATAAAVVIPQAMGYATVAGLPVEIGLYTCIFPLAAYALIGGARRLSFSTTSTIAALTGLALASVGTAQGAGSVSAAASLATMVGGAFLLLTILRMGWMVEAVSEAVLHGLRMAVGLTIIGGQLPKLLGVPPSDGGFFADVGDALSNLDSANGATVVLSVITIGGLLLVKQFAPKVPGALLAVAAGIMLATFTGVVGRGVELIDHVPTGLPGIELPDWGQIESLFPFALAIAFMSFIESNSAARGSRKLGEPRLDNDHELFSSGAANIVGGLFTAMPAGGGFSQTQVNTSAGANSQSSELITATLAVSVALFLAPVLSELPEATLASVIIVSVLGLIDPAPFIRIYRIDPLELAVALPTALAALVFDLLAGVVVGVAITLFLVLRTINHPRVTELRRHPESNEYLDARPEDPPTPGILVLRIEGGMYTMNVRRIQDEIYRRFGRAEPSPEVVLVDVGATVNTSLTVLDTWLEVDQHLSAHGAQLWFAAVPAAALVKAKRTPHFLEWVEAGRIHPSVASAVTAFEAPRP